MMGEHSRSDRTSSDDDVVLDDELSDDLSDNALENSSVGVSDIKGSCTHETPVQNTVSFCSKSDVNSSHHKDSNKAKQLSCQTSRRTSHVEARQNTSISTPSMPIGLTLGGQRVRIFNEIRPPPTPEEDNININNEASTGSEFTAHNSAIVGRYENNGLNVGTSRQPEKVPKIAAMSSSLIPRLASPRRPPRKMKTSSEPSSGCSNNIDVLIEEAEEEKENESAASVNSTETAGNSLSQLKDGNSSTAAEGGCIIKSILKKPSSSLPGEISTSPRTFSDTISKPDFTVCAAAVNSASSGQQHSPSPAAPSSGSSDFYLPTFQEYKQQHRKKKQVQFKVTNDVTVLKPVEGNSKLDAPVTTTGSATFLTSATVIKPHVSQVAQGKVDVDEPNDTLLSAKTEKRTRCDEQETEPVREEWSNEDTFLKEEENQVDYEKGKPTISFDVKENYKAEIFDKDEFKGLVNDNVTPDVSSEERNDIRSDERVKLQYFGVSDVEVVNSGNVSCGKTASRSCEERTNDATDDRNSPDNTPAVLDANSGRTETTSGEYLT
jgi:hypothetical protein